MPAATHSRKSSLDGGGGGVETKKRPSSDKLFINTNIPEKEFDNAPKTTRDTHSTQGLEEDMRKLQIRPATVSEGRRSTRAASSLSPGHKTRSDSVEDKPACTQKDGWVSPCHNDTKQDKQEAHEPPPPSSASSSSSSSDKRKESKSSSLDDHVVTPTNGADKEKKFDLPGTLETMHEQLARSLMAEPGTALDMAAECCGYKDGGGSQLWVTKWVDYTSKYGLGFLLNNGSAGVYFNDSSKIVLSVNGSNFEYYERNRKSKEAKEERYTLQEYPESLQKKVTLLKHFTNYLVEQQKKTAGDEGEPLEPALEP
jgi:hypothetical protein